ncbi:unnamed protein product [marine sediment metagenome]|uniref:Uncharacterized protein n=1 Tax=marine sediment metagenome TaxID=412755 RepID=X1AF45_9ZZZZ
MAEEAYVGIFGSFFQGDEDTLVWFGWNVNCFLNTLDSEIEWCYWVSNTREICTDGSYSGIYSEQEGGTFDCRYVPYYYFEDLNIWLTIQKRGKA